jgi:hypothetical protein
MQVSDSRMTAGVDLEWIWKEAVTDFYGNRSELAWSNRVKPRTTDVVACFWA